VTDVDQTGVATSTTRVDHIPVTWVSPADRRAQTPLAQWMPALGTNKEWVVPFLGELASAGFLAAQWMSMSLRRRDGPSRREPTTPAEKELCPVTDTQPQTASGKVLCCLLALR
jgi:hypothetical protein